MSPGAGWTNAHTHLYSGLAPLGMPAPAETPRDFPEILRSVWWRLDRALDERSLHAAARLYVAEALLAGTTGLVDHHESPSFVEGSLDVLADACEELGMRALLCYGATERNGGRDEARRGLEECRRFARENERPLVRGCVGLHASFTVSDETIAEAGELARELGTVVHVHVAEDACDVRDARERGFAGPLQRLLARGGLPPGSILAHGVHLDEAEVRLARERDLWLVQNPRSNRANGVGYPRALAASDRVALGTDGFPSDPDDEIEVLLRDGPRNGDDPRAAAARAERGEQLLAERFGASAPEVEVRRGAIAVAGRPVVQDGALAAADLEAIRAEARVAAPSLWARMAAIE